MISDDNYRGTNNGNGVITSWSKVGTCGCTVHRKYRKIASLKSTDETPWQGSKAMDSQVSSIVKMSVVNTDNVSEISGKTYTTE